MEIILKKTKQVILIDDEDAYLCRAPQLARDGIIYCRWWENKKHIRRPLHRLIMREPVGLEVDHINRDRFDNRKCNLRTATRSQNGCNRDRPNIKLKHKYKGIGYHPLNHKRPYAAKIKVNKKVFYGGYFATVEEAALRYNELAKIHHGEFAVLNNVVMDANEKE